MFLQEEIKRKKVHPKRKKENFDFLRKRKFWEKDKAKGVSFAKNDGII